MKIGGVHTTLDPFKVFFFFFNYHFKNTEFGKSFGYCITLHFTQNCNLDIIYQGYYH